ncbi:MAG: PAM68 family protein [Cyanobacteria bacterium P01_A01_bin.17]
MAANSRDDGSSAAGFATDAEPTVAEKKKKPRLDAPKKASKKKKAPRRLPTRKAENAQSAIPKVVSDRMVKRVLIISGIPSVLAFGVFPVSYYASLKGWVSLPPFVTLAASVTCLTLGLGGISYGVLSASWDEDIEGSAAGLKEFKLNLGRLRDSRKAQKG